jgi:hypothetical protein
MRDRRRSGGLHRLFVFGTVLDTPYVKTRVRVPCRGSSFDNAEARKISRANHECLHSVLLEDIHSMHLVSV